MAFSDTFGWPLARCVYPSWLAGRAWRDLAGRFRYKLNNAGDEIELRELRRGGGGSSGVTGVTSERSGITGLTSERDAEQTLRCYAMSLADNATTANQEFTSVAFASYGW